METKYLKPREGLLIRDPATMVPLPAEGEIKPWIGPEGRYWRRRVNFGDVTIASPSQKEKMQRKNFKNGEEGTT